MGDLAGAGAGVNRPQGLQAEPFLLFSGHGHCRLSASGRGPEPKAALGPAPSGTTRGKERCQPQGLSPLVLGPDEGLLGLFRLSGSRAGLHDAPGEDA